MPKINMSSNQQKLLSALKEGTIPTHILNSDLSVKVDSASERQAIGYVVRGDYS